MIMLFGCLAGMQLDGIAAADDDDAGVFGAARELLEGALEREEAGLASTTTSSPAASQYEQLLQALSAAAANTQVCTRQAWGNVQACHASKLFHCTTQWLSKPHLTYRHLQDARFAPVQALLAAAPADALARRNFARSLVS